VSGADYDNYYVWIFPMSPVNQRVASSNLAGGAKHPFSWLRTAFPMLQFCGLLPDMNRGDARWSRAALNHLRFENDFNIFLFPVLRHLFQHVFHTMSID